MKALVMQGSSLQGKVQKMKWLVQTKAKKIGGYVLALYLAVGNLMMTTAFATSDLENGVKTMANSIFSFIRSISTVTCGVIVAYCLFTMIVSKEERKVSSAMDWIKRAIICWVAIFGVSLIISWVYNNVGMANWSSQLFQPQ